MRQATSAAVRLAWIERREIALLDVREEAHHAEGHPLFAANLSISRIELDAYTRLPCRAVPIVVFDDGEGYALRAADRLIEMGYIDVSLLAGGLRGWRDAGYEIFRDVNSPSKAFGELVESVVHTPSLSAQEVHGLIERGEDIAIVDARRYEEFQTMSIPTAASAPGGELVWRMGAIAGNPSTRVIVNCAGRTRSILGTQSLINAGIPNRVAALRNGTIGWKLAKQVLDHGAELVIPPPDADAAGASASAARRVADRAGVGRTTLDVVEQWLQEGQRTVYRFDVRTPAEYSAGHLEGFRSAPGGQLVQETDMFAPVRGARIVLTDEDGARGNMSASWLAQMNWEVYVVDGIEQALRTKALLDDGAFDPIPVPASASLSPAALDERLRRGEVVLLDFSRSREYRKAHVPGSWFTLRSGLREALVNTAHAASYCVTSQETHGAQLAWQELSRIAGKPVFLLEGGNDAWKADGFPVDSASPLFASAPVDYYRRPYEGTDASAEAMQAYLDWEFGLVDQLERDGTHGFRILEL